MLGVRGGIGGIAYPKLPNTSMIDIMKLSPVLSTFPKKDSCEYHLPSLRHFSTEASAKGEVLKKAINGKGRTKGRQIGRKSTSGEEPRGYTEDSKQGMTWLWVNGSSLNPTP